MYVTICIVNILNISGWVIKDVNLTDFSSFLPWALKTLISFFHSNSLHSLLTYDRDNVWHSIMRTVWKFIPNTFTPKTLLSPSATVSLEADGYWGAWNEKNLKGMQEGWGHVFSNGRCEAQSITSTRSHKQSMWCERAYLGFSWGSSAVTAVISCPLSSCSMKVDWKPSKTNPATGRLAVSRADLSLCSKMSPPSSTPNITDPFSSYWKRNTQKSQCNWQWIS